MVSTLQWVLLGLGLYWALIIFLRRRGLLPSYVGTQGPILTLHTRRFRELLDRIASPKRTWRAWGNYGVGVALVVMAGMFAFLAIAAVVTVLNPGQPTAVNQPRNALVIPGVNDFLPLSVAPEIVLGLAIGIVVHEGGHGVMCRVGDINVESMGLVFLGPILLGAFVEPDEDARREADRGDQTRMFAAGVMNNFALTVVAFALLFGPVAGSIAVADGAAVGGTFPGSAAAQAGIDQGDRIVGVDDREIDSANDLDETLETVEDITVEVRVDDGDEVRAVPVERTLLVTGVIGGTPFAEAFDVDPENPTRIEAVNGTPVGTQQSFNEALESRRIATVTAADGSSATSPIGASVQILSGDPADRAGFPGGATAIVTAIDDERTVSSADLMDALAETRGGDSVTVELFLRGDGGWESQTRTVELDADDDGSGYLGVGIFPGISGLSVSDFGVRLYPAEDYLGLLGGGGGAGTFLERVGTVLLLPFASVGSNLPFNFAGFTGGIENFYVVDGPLAALGGGLFFVANLLFWTGWINLNLGVFNCIPAFPLDGGHILRASTESIVARLPVPGRRRLTTAITTSIGLIMLASLLIALFGPQLLN